MSIDRLDAALLDLLHTEPKVGVLERRDAWEWRAAPSRRDSTGSNARA